MGEYPEIAARFARDTTNHEMTILHDDGLYRHLRFRDPKHGFYWFDLITWPGCLTIRGDYGDAYTITREPDMFDFFRSKSGRINPHYWAQKLDSGRDSVMKYDQDIFENRVKEYVADAIRDGWAPRGIGKAVREEILNSEFLADEHEARKALEGFEFGVGYRAECRSCAAGEDVTSYSGGLTWEFTHKRAVASRKHDTDTRRTEGFTFSDVWEWSFSDYDWTFLWACHAIVQGISQYDARPESGAASSSEHDKELQAA